MTSDRYAVIGHPIGHSLSPRIHTRFAEQTGEDLVYERIEAPVDGFAAAATAFFGDGGRGLNVTVPFKAEALAWADRAGDRAAAAGVANTLTRMADGAVEADNTDGVGLVRDLVDNLGLVLDGAYVLLIGAGGAARGALGPLLAERPAGIHIVNRTAGRARELAADFTGQGTVGGGGFDDIGERTFDLVINASAASLGGAVPPIPPGVVAPGGTVYDMMYGEAAAPFLDWGRRAGAERLSDGLGMLVEQAAESFRIWRGILPETAPVLAELRAETGT